MKKPNIIFMGTPDFSAVILRALCEADASVLAVVTQPDKPQGRKMKLTPSPVKVFAESLGIPVLQPNRVRSQAFISTLKALSPDLIITAAYGKILPKGILDIPKYGCLNVHGSILPKYRGAAPVQWAILNGEKISGITIMKMDEGMDTGDILSEKKVDIPLSMNANDLMTLLSEEGARLLLSTIPSYIEGEMKPVLQEESLATYAPMIEKEQGLIDWEKDAIHIHNQVRGLSMWPGTHTFFAGGRLKIIASSPVENARMLLQNYSEIHGVPKAGTVIDSASGKLLVACGNETALALLHLQLPSGKRLLAKDCAHNFHVGTKFFSEALS